MARILVGSMPFSGHAAMMAPIAAELVRRGHEVVAHTGAKYEHRFTSVGATWLPWTPDFDDHDLAATFPRMGNGKGMRAGRAGFMDMLVGTGAAQAADLLAEARRRPFDLFVSDHLAFGSALAAEVLGTRWASVAVTPLMITSRDLPPPGIPLSPADGPAGRARDALLRKVFSRLNRMFDPALDEMRAAAGLGPGPTGRGLEGLYSPHLVLAQGVAGLEYERSDLPAHVRLVGRLAMPAPATDVASLPSWWSRLDAARTAGRPVVHVTQGTLDTDPAGLLRPAVAAFAGHRALVVCTTGGLDPSVLGPLPDNVVAAPFVPHDLLLPSVDVMVTNGGWGGALAALSAGVPLVVAGDSMDKPEVARRVGRSGAGIDLRTGKPSPRALRHAVDRVLDEPGRTRRARELAGALAAAGGTPEAGRLVEELLVRG